MLAIASAAKPPTAEELLAKLREPLEKIIREEIAPDVEPEKQWQLKQAAEADFVYRGLQWIYPTMGADGSTSFSAAGSPITGNPSGSQGLYDYIQNIYRGYCRKFVAVLGQRIPNVVATPDDPDDDASLATTEQANVGSAILDAAWDTELRSLELCLHLYKNGTTFAYTPWVTDKTKYGSTQQPKMQQRTVQTGPATYSCLNCGAEVPDSFPPPESCPQCGGSPLQRNQSPTMSVPEMSGVQEYDNGSVEFHLTTVMTTSTPFFIKDLDEALWLEYRYDESKWRLMRVYPQLRPRRSSDANSGGSDTASASLGTMVRDAASSPTGTPQHRQNRWDYRRLWIKADLYEALATDDDDSLRELALEHFAEGMKITMVEGKIIEIEEEKLTDVWAACKPETSEYIFADPMGTDMLPAQRLKNDTLNIAYQTIEGGLPLHFADPRVLNVDWLNSQSAMPNRFIPVIAQLGSQLSDSIHQTQPSVFSDQMIPWMAGVENDARIGIGTTESVYGGIVPGDEQTAHEAELRKNAALQQLGITFVYIRKFWAKAKTNGVKMLAKYGTGMLRKVRKGEQGFESLVLDFAKLKEGGWHFEAEESFPVSHAEQRAYLLWMLANPQIAQSQGFMDPRNISKNHALLGFTGYKVGGQDAHDKAQDIFAELLKGAPIQKPSDDGSVDTQPSVPIDEFDDHTQMASEAHAWCISRIGRKLREQNEQGFNNVVAWGKAHFVAANVAPPPPPPPPAKLNISMPLDKMAPEITGQVMEDFHLMPGAPPPAPAPVGSTPAPKATASQPAPVAPPNSAAGAPPMPA